jgi:hypothetical protein
MNDEAFDDLLDNASHAVFEMIPDEAMAEFTATQRNNLLYRINDALTEVLRDFLEIQ